MATQKSNFVLVGGTAPVFTGSGSVTPPAVLPVNGPSAQVLAQAANHSVMDTVTVDLSVQGYAKNAGVGLTLTGTTAITINAAALAAATGVVVGGDTSFSTLNQITFKNTGSVDLVVSPGASNGLAMNLGGTSPTITVPAGSSVVIQSAAGITVDSTHKNITITPTSGGSMSVTFGGA